MYQGHGRDVNPSKVTMEPHEANMKRKACQRRATVKLKEKVKQVAGGDACPFRKAIYYENGLCWYPPETVRAMDEILGSADFRKGVCGCKEDDACQFARAPHPAIIRLAGDCTDPAHKNTVKELAGKHVCVKLLDDSLADFNKDLPESAEASAPGAGGHTPTAPQPALRRPARPSGMAAD